jgi:DNA-binding NtrC family response regulator
MNERKIPKRLRGKNYYQSVSRKLLKENKITPEFEVMFSSLKLEEIISLKLELAAKTVNGKLYGYPIWNSTNLIVKDSLIKFALSATSSHKEAANILGISISELKRFIKKYHINEYFDNRDT